MLETLKNLFAVADLRNRVLFTLGMLAVYRVGNHIPTPGVNSEALRILARAGAEHAVRHVRHVHGRQPVAHHHLRAGRDAVHQLVDHPAAADGGVAVPRAAVEGRRARPPQDHAVHALPDAAARGRAVARHRHLSRAPDADRRRPAAGLRPGLGLPPRLHADADDRHDVHHVARRADHRARHRQRHVAHHLRGHRRQFPARGDRDVRPVAHRPDRPADAGDPRGADGRRDCARSSTSSAAIAASPCSTPSASSGGASTAARARTFR